MDNFTDLTQNVVQTSSDPRLNTFINQTTSRYQLLDKTSKVSTYIHKETRELEYSATRQKPHEKS